MASTRMGGVAILFRALICLALLGGASAQTRSPTTVPTASPVAPPVGSATDQPTTAPTESPVSAPTPNPTDEPTPTPETNEPTTLPTATATDNPTTAAPSQNPTTVAPTTLFPSVQPSLRPSWNPTREPTTSSPTPPNYTPPPSFTPSEVPTHSPTTTHAPTPLNQTPRPTSKPFQAPTPQGTQLTGDIAGARITLMNVGTLDGSAQTSFERVMDAWLEGAYDGRRRRLLRQLQAAGITDLAVTTSFQGQQPVDGSNTLTYDQTILYRTLNPNVTLASIVTEPFNDQFLNEVFRGSLRSSNTAFGDLPNTMVAAPIIPAPSSGDDGPDTTLYIIVICAAAGALIIAVGIGYVIIRRRRQLQQEKPGSELIAPAQKSPMSADIYSQSQDPPPPKRISSPNDRRIEEIYGPDNPPPPNTSLPDDAFEYQSVSTMGFDYNKVLAGDFTVMTESVPGDSRPGMVVDAAITSSRSQEDALTVDDAIKDAPDEHVIEINAPSGMLGVVIVSPDDGPPVVHAVKDSSVLRDKVRIGDKLLKVDEVDVTDMTAVRVSRLISQRSGQKRKFTLLRRVDA